jgi:hypothetical protein
MSSLSTMLNYALLFTGISVVSYATLLQLIHVKDQISECEDGPPLTVSLLVDQARRTYLLLYGAEHEDKLQTQVSLRYLTSDELKASGVAPNQVADRQ